jgi:DNA polymerase III subunit gamma/tau
LVIDLVNAIQVRDTAQGLETIHRALDGGSDPRQYARQVVEYLRSLLLIRMGNEKQVEATKEGKQLMRRHSQSVEIPVLMEWIRLFNNAINDLRTSWQPSMALEIAFAQAAGLQDHLEPKSQIVKEPVKTEKSQVAQSVVSENKEKIPSVAEKTPAQAQIETSNTPVQGKTSQHMEGISTQDILANWNTIRAEVKSQRSQTEALLNSHKHVQVNDGVLVIGFASEVLKSKMESAENIEVTRQAILRILKVDLPITCVVVSGKMSSSTVDMDVDSDGIVGAALNLGGKLVKRD